MGIEPVDYQYYLLVLETKNVYLLTVVRCKDIFARDIGSVYLNQDDVVICSN